MLCNVSIIIGSSEQFMRVKSFMFTMYTWNVGFSSKPYLATRVNPKLHNSRVQVHDAHLRALEQLINSNEKCAFIFEDDVVPAYNKTLNKLHELLGRLPSNWNYLNMGRCYSLCSNQECVVTGLVRNDRSLCRHAYAVHRTTAYELLRHTKRLKTPGDIEWSYFLNRHYRNTTFSSSTRWYNQDRKTFKSRNGRNDSLDTCEFFSNKISSPCL